MPDSFDLGKLGLVLAAMMSSLVLGYLMLSEVKPRRTGNYSGVLTFVGGYNLMLGLLILASWIGFFVYRLQNRSTMVEGAAPGSFTPAVFIHVGLELGASISLIQAGYSLLKNHPRSAFRLYSAIALLVFTQAWAMLTFGFKGHDALMDTAVMWALVIFSGITGLFYGWEHYVLRLDKRAQRLPMPNLPEEIDARTRKAAADIQKAA